jgi:hypothetical protein
MRMTWLTIAALLIAGALAMGGCGATEITDSGGDGGRDSTGQADVYPPPPPPSAHVKGIVYAPKGTSFNPPLTVMNALVYLTDRQPKAIPQQAYCERCTEVPASATYTLTDARGAFDLNVSEGSYMLVVQKGQFRLVRAVVVAHGETLVVPAEDTTMPSRPSDDGNDSIPKIALLIGQYDHLEGLFAKLGLAQLAAGGEAIEWTSDTFFDVWANGGTVPPAPIYKGTSLQLLSSLAQMMQYHIIFVPCSGEAETVVSNTTVQQNLRDYVKAGGKFYVADWSYDYLRQTWDNVHFAGGDGSPLGGANDVSGSFDSQGHAVDTSLYDWLEAQTTGWGGESLVLKENWDWIMSLSDGYVGEMEGEPVYQKPDVIVEGPHRAGVSWKTLPATDLYPLTVGFPYGCGRVLYTTYHTVGEMGAGHADLLPQERILVYLIMEIGVCQSGPILE